VAKQITNVIMLPVVVNPAPSILMNVNTTTLQNVICNALVVPKLMLLSLISSAGPVLIQTPAQESMTPILTPRQ